GIVPMYLLTYPVASQPAGYGPLAEYLADRKCEVGAQLHPWVTPPFEEAVNIRNSFPGNLGFELECEKLRVLTQVIEDKMGIRPTVYRAGRYGVGPRTADILKRLGYLVDTSIVPRQVFAEQGGPNFFECSADPYWTDSAQTLLELPVSSALV